MHWRWCREATAERSSTDFKEVQIVRWGKSYMDELGGAVCAICGEERLGGSTWFLVAEYRWDDKLKILHWSDYLVAYDGVEAACSTAHVRELVVHWMTTGSLRYPFARALYQGGSRRKAKILKFVRFEAALCNQVVFGQTYLLPLIS